jgi:hypothetical protein
MEIGMAISNEKWQELIEKIRKILSEKPSSGKPYMFGAISTPLTVHESCQDKEIKELIQDFIRVEVISKV